MKYLIVALILPIFASATMPQSEGNICKVLCSGDESSTDNFLEDSHKKAFLQDQLIKRQAEIDFIKEALRNNTNELTSIRIQLSDFLHHQPVPQVDSTTLRVARAGVSLRQRQLSMSTKSDQETSSIEDSTPVTNDDVIRELPADCEEVRQSLGKYYIGRYYTQIKVRGEQDSNRVFLAGCELRDDAGWLIISKRLDGSVSFDRPWDDYKKGFGHAESEFWLGNEHIHRLTNQKNYKLRVELQTGSGRRFYAEYANFRVMNEADNYRLIVSGYLGGSAGDALTGILSHNGSQFTTNDRDNDKYEAGNCAAQYHGGWWFHSCFVAFLNGIVPNGNPNQAAQVPPGFTTKDAQSWHARKVRSFYVPAMMQDGIVWRTINVNKRQTRDSSYYDDVLIKMATMMIAPGL